MKKLSSKTKKTVVAWVVGTLFVGVVTGLATWMFHFGITSFPMLVQVLSWTLTQTLALCGKLWN